MDYKATKSNKKEVPARFWYLQMLRKQTDSLTEILFQLEKDGVNVGEEIEEVLLALKTASNKVTDKFPDPRK